MRSILTTLTIFIVGLQKEIICEREHKVHNIVLYPEKHSWCQITPIQQVVGSPGYDSVTIDNNVCVGACYSYSIPKTQPAEPGELIGPYCDSCQPSETICYHVNLKQVNKNVEEPKVLQKKVQIITNCSCQSCDILKQDGCEITDNETMELPENLFIENKNTNKSIDDIPDLLDTNSTIHHKSVHDIKLKNKLKKWFETYRGEIEDNDIKVPKDMNNLLQTVENIDISEYSNAVPANEQHENNVPTENLENKHTLKHHITGEGPTDHGHHLGEEQQIGEQREHLVKGPHGSLVAEPVEVKFHIDSDDLKPNDEGIVINYENPQYDSHHHHHHHHHHHPHHHNDGDQINE